MEIYKVIKGFEELYEVSNYGNVRSIRRKGKVMKPYKMPNGYLHVALTSDKCYSLRIHRLVAQAFKTNPNNLPEVNHLDGNKENNNDWNLEWTNRSNNMLHALENGLTSAIGETHYRAKLTENQVVEIRKKYSEGEKQITLAKEYNVSDKTIHVIVKNKRWKSIL